MGTWMDSKVLKFVGRGTHTAAELPELDGEEETRQHFLSQYVSLSAIESLIIWPLSLFKLTW